MKQKSLVTQEATVEAVVMKVSHVKEPCLAQEVHVKMEKVAPIKVEESVQQAHADRLHKSVVVEESVSDTVVVKSEASQVKKNKPVKHCSVIWRPDTDPDRDRFGLVDPCCKVRCRLYDPAFLGLVGPCEECEEAEYEEQLRARSTLQEEIHLAPFVARDPATGKLYVCTEPTYEKDDAFNELIQCFANSSLEAPKANTSNLKVTLASIVQMFLQKLPLKIIAVRLPLSTHESLVTASSWACCLNFGVYVGRNLKVKVVYRSRTGRQTVGRRPVYYGRDCEVMNRLWLCLWRCYHRSTGVFRALDNWVRSFYLIALVSHCPRVVQFECRGCAEGWHVERRELQGFRMKCQRGEHVRVFPSVDMVRWWQGWLAHAGYVGRGHERLECYDPDYENGLFVAYCPQCSPKFQKAVSVQSSHPALWHMYARGDWPDARGRVKYNTLTRGRKREVRKAIKRYKVRWDKEYDTLTKANAEYWKEETVRRQRQYLQQEDEMAGTNHQDQEEEGTGLDEEMPFYSFC